MTMTKETKGKFISISGLDGVGKSTVLYRVSLALQELDVKHCITEEPSKSGNSHKIRELVKYGPDFSSRAMLCLVTASRYETMEYLIKPALNRGTHVFAHRWLADSRAYQDYQMAGDLHKIVCDDFMPDLQIILDAPAKHCIERIKKRQARQQSQSAEKPDKFDNASEEVMEERRSMFMRQIFEPGVAIIDAYRDIELVYKDTFNVIKKTLGI